MTTTIVAMPLGTTGNLSVTESAGVLSVDLTEALLAGGIKAQLKLDIGASALFTAVAASTTNATLKAIMTEAAAIAAAIPA